MIIITGGMSREIRPTFVRQGLFNTLYQKSDIATLIRYCHCIVLRNFHRLRGNCKKHGCRQESSRQIF